jgi:hypothetical protein
VKKDTVAFASGLLVVAVLAVSAWAAAPVTDPPAMPVSYPCEVVGSPNTGVVHAWDDQFYPEDAPLCGEIENTAFAVCLNSAGYDIWSVDQGYIEEILGWYLEAGVNAKLGACQFADRSFPLCYAAGANSIYYKSRAEAIALLAAGAKVPVASKSAQTDYKVGAHHLTCAGGTATGRVVSTGNGGEVVVNDTIGAGLLQTNPLDYTIEVS